MIFSLLIARYSGAAHILPALLGRYKGKKEFYAKIPVVEFAVILCNVLFYFV